MMSSSFGYAVHQRCPCASRASNPTTTVQLFNTGRMMQCHVPSAYGRQSQGGDSNEQRWYSGENEGSSSDSRQGQGSERGARRAHSGGGRGQQGTSQDRSGPSPWRRLGASPASSAGDSSSPRRNIPLESPESGFLNMRGVLAINIASGKVVKHDSWEVMFGKILSEDHAESVLELMLQDAELRDKLEWDWSENGYGSLIGKFVQGAGAAGALATVQRVLDPEVLAALRLNVTSKELVPGIMRKLGPMVESSEMHEWLYLKERELRNGTNSHDSTYELSRVFRRLNQVEKVQTLHQAIEAGRVTVKAELAKDIKEWVEKRAAAQ